jgi:hypothetical protein
LGFSLLEVAVGVGLVGSGLAILATLSSAQIRGQKRLDLKFNRMTVVRSIADNLSCPVTVRTNFPDAATLTLRNGQVVPLYDRLGNVIVSGNGAAPTVIGGYTVRAIAHTVGPTLGFEVEVARPRRGVADPLSDTLADDQFETDPVMKSMPVRWRSPSSLLFPAGSFPCATQFVTNCVQTCPAGSVMTGIDPDTKYASCVDVTCPPGDVFQGLSPTNTKICATPLAPCPPGQLRIGPDCRNLLGAGTNSLVEEVRNKTQVLCRMISDTTPSKTPSDLSCDPDEFLASSGGQCVDSTGGYVFGLVAGNLRFPGYFHTSWPTAVNHLSVDCYGTPGDPPQGYVVTRAICCKYRLGFDP